MGSTMEHRGRVRTHKRGVCGWACGVGGDCGCAVSGVRAVSVWHTCAVRPARGVRAVCAAPARRTRSVQSDFIKKSSKTIQNKMRRKTRFFRVEGREAMRCKMHAA